MNIDTIFPGDREIVLLSNEFFFLSSLSMKEREEEMAEEPSLLPAFSLVDSNHL